MERMQHIIEIELQHIWNLGSYLQAEVDCTAAINLDAEDVKACLWRGTARETLSNYKEATEDFKYTLILEPTNKTANLALNILSYLSRQDYTL